MSSAAKDEVTVLFDTDVDRLADMGELIGVMKEVFAHQRDDKLVSPPRNVVKLPAGDLVFTVGGTPDYGGFRVYNTFGRIKHTQQFLGSANPDARPEMRQVVVVFDMATNQMQGVIIGDHLSAYRSGSISGAAMDLMAPREVGTLALLGTGHHAKTQLLAATAVRRFREIRVFSRTPERRANFVAEMSPRVGLAIKACETAEQAVRGADVLVSATTSGTPVYDADWVAPHAYVCSVGPKSRLSTEIPAAIAARAAYICTDAPMQFEAFRASHALAGTPDFDRVRPVCDWLDGPPSGAGGIRLFLMEGLAGTEVITGACLIAAARRKT